MNKKRIKQIFFGIAPLLVVLCFFAVGIHAADAKTIKAGMFSSSGNLIKEFSIIPKGADVAIGDVKGDATNEVVFGSPAGKQPEVTMLNADGSKASSFIIYGTKNKPAVHVEIGDVTGDGTNEIVVCFGSNYKPEIRIYQPDGKLIKTFLLFGKGGYTGGVTLAVSDVTGDGIRDIIAAAGNARSSTLYVANAKGQIVSQFDAFSYTLTKGMTVDAEDLNGDGIGEIITATKTIPSHIKIFSSDGDAISGFKVNMALSAMSADASHQEIVAAASAKGKTSIQSFTLNGKKGSMSFTAYSSGAGDTTSVDIADASASQDPQIILAPGATIEITPKPSDGRLIVIDISEQRMRRYENGKLIATHVISSGKVSMPTPTGNFQIRNKMTTAYSRAYHLYMDNWMAFTPDGKYGIHSLPYWKLKSGIVYEGLAHLGIRVSHGCVRLSPQESKIVFQWASVGVPIKIQN